MSVALDRFNQVVGQLPTEHRPPAVSDDALGVVPGPLACFYRDRGYVGLPSFSQMRAVQRRAMLALRPGQLRPVSYTQFNSASAPMRVAYIKSKILGMSFEGVDCLTPGEHSMSGYSGRFRVMNSTLADLRQGNLHSVLSELLIFPHLAFAPWIRWGETSAERVEVYLDPHHPGVAGLDVHGVLLFPGEGRTAAYHTADRMQVTGSKAIPLPWTARIAGFSQTGGIHQPTALSAHWHEPGEQATADDVTQSADLPEPYFRSNTMDITYLH